MSNELTDLFARNRQWAADTEERHPGFFTGLLAKQTPKYMWIGCADSRVPANEIVGLLPGEMFVHRNVANVVVHSDLNCLSVIQFAIDVLEVQHIMVVGHYGCGGVKAALLKQRVGLVDNWLRHVQDVANTERMWLASIADETARLNALCELNVLAQCVNVCESTVVQGAWERGQTVIVHGWVYGLHDGLIDDLKMSVSAPGDVDYAHAAALLAVKRRYDQSAASAAGTGSGLV